jgi:amino acid adenylation domain-containing protein
MCARQPDAAAVADEDGELTYAELDRRSGELAATLAAHGVAAEEPVALLLPRGRDLVVAMLGVQRAGSPYLPLDVDHPEARLAAILADAAPPVVVTTGALARTSLAGTGRTVLLIEDLGAVPADFTPPDHEDRLAHLIYTSGSTGTPKGVAVGHRGVLNLIDDFAARVPVGPGDACGWWTSPAFDVSVHEVFTALAAGATVEVCPADVRNDAPTLMEWLVRRHVVSAYLPPHLLPAVAEWLAEHPNRVALRALLVGVEPIPQPLLRRIAALVPGLAIINGYGPTECTVWATFHHLAPDGTEDGITPLGFSVTNGPIHLLDGGMRLVPVGAVGEIHIGGLGVARGYHGQPGLTSERFVPSPFTPGQRLYRTGDLARYRPDGELVFLGRADQQAKVRGMRVEPREIETVLTGHPEVSSAVVLAESAAPDTRLLGYAGVAADRVADEALAADILRHLRSRLPGPMVPAHVLLVHEWPTTVNGKIDRSRLPRPGAAHTEYVVPVGEIEETIAEVWAELLEQPQVGRTDDFFGLGGHSLLAARASADLSRRLNLPVEPCHVMDHPTVAELGAALAARPEAPVVNGLDLSRVLLEHVIALPVEALEQLEGDRS